MGHDRLNIENNRTTIVKEMHDITNEYINVKEYLGNHPTVFITFDEKT